MSKGTSTAVFALAGAVMCVYVYMCHKRIALDPIPMATVKAAPVVLCAIAAKLRGAKTRFSGLVALGLVLSAAGDVFLEMDDNAKMAKNELWFIAGLGSFLVAHLFYIAAFWSTATNLTLPRVAPFAVYAGVLLFVLLPHVEQALRVPVVVYGIVIALMGVTAAHRMNSPMYTRTSAQLAMLGALSFIASDSTLALNKFRSPVPYAKVIVMVTYYAGQLLIGLSSGGGSIVPKGKAH